MGAKVKLPKYPNGGSYGDYRGNFWEKTRDTLGNYGKASADTYLSMFGLNNVIGDNAYKGYNAQQFKGYAQGAGQVAQIAGQVGLPMLGQAFGVPAPLVSAGLQGLSMANPQGQQLYPHGGQIGIPNAELELQENTLNPNGSTTQFDGQSHAQGGIKTNLDPGTLVFSDRLKLPGTKKTFADLNKPYNTKKEDKLINADNSNKTQRETAELMKSVKNKQSLNLYNVQEETKFNKVASYAKKLGLSDVFAYGGQIPKYYTGGPYGPYNKNDLPIMLNPYAALYANNANSMKGMTPSIESDTKQNLNLNQTLANQGPTIQTYGKHGNFPTNWGVGDSTPQVATNWGRQKLDIPWGSIAEQGALALAQNIGNLYDLKRSKKADVQSYERVNPATLDPTQSLRYNDMVFRTAKDSLKNASGGNASTYLQNYKDLAINRMTTNDRIRQDYGNQNIAILNNAQAFNANVQRAESDNNLANLGQTRNIRSQAIHNIGDSAINQYRAYKIDKNSANRDTQMLTLMAKTYPELLNNPDIRKALGLN